MKAAAGCLVERPTYSAFRLLQESLLHNSMKEYLQSTEQGRGPEKVDMRDCEVI
jgi:hypothetical protein